MGVYIAGLKMPQTDENGTRHGIQVIIDSEGSALANGQRYKAMWVADYETCEARGLFCPCDHPCLVDREKE